MALNEQQMAQFMAAQQAEAREQVLYTFNCGSMEMVGKTVTADKRKGKAVLSMEDDGLLRFQWRLRHSDNNEQQYFVFPGGATWTKVSECKDGRVFLLKFKDSEVRRFFWMQEPTSTAAKKDAEVLKRVSSLIASPPKFGAPIPKEEESKDAAEADVAMVDVAGVAGTSGSIESRTSGETATVQGTDRPAANPNAANQEHRGAVLSPQPATVAGAGTAATPSAAAATPAAAAASSSAPAAAGAAGALNANSLLSTLNAMAQQLQARQEAESGAGAGVEDVLDASRVQPLLDVDAGLVDALVEFLPEGQRSPEALRAQLRSPQMQQTMSRLTSILNSAQFGQLMASLSLPATGGLGVDAFLKAIQEQAKKQQDDKGAK